MNDQPVPFRITRIVLTIISIVLVFYLMFFVMPGMLDDLKNTYHH